MSTPSKYQPPKVLEVCLICKDGSPLEVTLCDDQRCPRWKHRLIRVEE